MTNPTPKDTNSTVLRESQPSPQLPQYPLLSQHLGTVFAKLSCFCSLAHSAP